jgi:hypothetical protein
MHVYLDESGDTGFRLAQGSSRFFVIALLVVDDPDPLEETLAALRAEMRMPNYEFKFAQSDDAKRYQFFQTIRDERYEAHCQIVDKRELLEQRAVLPQFRSREGLYGHLVRRALREIAEELVAATLVIDESFKSKNEKARFTTALRQELGGALTADTAIGSIRYRDSRRESLLQVADMLVGAVARSYEAGDSRFRQLIPRHRLTVRELRP